MALQSFPALLARLGAWRDARLAPELDAQAIELQPEELARVRLTAELAADRLCGGTISCVGNPWRRGMRQHVLWETSYQARLMEHGLATADPVDTRQLANTFASSNGVVTSSWS